MKKLGDVIYWESMAAVIWSVALEAALLVVLVCVDINILYPVTWLQAFSNVMSAHLWICFLPLAVITIIQGIMCSKKFLTVTKYSSTRFGIFRSLLSPHNFLMIIVFPVMSFLVSWAFLSAIGKDYIKVTGSCKRPGVNCVTEGYVFLVFNGIWCGFHFFLTNYIWDSNIFMCSVVQQLKFIQVKSELWPLIKQAMFKAIWPNLYFLIFFYYKSEFIYDFFNLSVAKGELDLPLILHAWLFSVVFIFTVLTTRYLLQVYLTQHLEFPVAHVLAESVTLHQAIAMKEHHLIQNLGCYDLMIMARSDFCRRQELFSLSQPGGHPHNWNALIKEVLKLVDDFTIDLNCANAEAGISLNSSKPAVCPTSPAPVVVKHSHLHSIRNLSMMQDPTRQESQFENAPFPLVDYCYDLVKKRFMKYVDAFKKKPVIQFLFGNIPDARLRHVLSHSSHIVWTTQGLACLAATSLKEDKFGVVLKDLPAVVTSLVNLKQTLDRIPKTGTYKRSQKNEQDEAKLKLSLKSAVKRGLYNICVSYGESILQVELPKNVQSQLLQYLSFKEG